MNTWLITGGCGFIGTALVRRLLSMPEQCTIRVVDNLSVGSLADLQAVADVKEVPASEAATTKHDGVVFIKGDIRDYDTMYAVSEGVDCVVHFAANSGVPYSVEHPRFDMEQNVQGTFNALEAARNRKVANFVFASSSAIAGNTAPPMHEDMVARPISPYGASKLAGEGYCSVYAHSYGIKTVMLRFGNVYGPCPAHKTSVVAKFINRALRGEVCEIYGDGAQTRDFIFIEDLLSAVLAAASYEKGGEAFQIATSKERTVGEMASLLSEELEKQGVSMQLTYTAPRLGDVVRNYSDTSKAKSLLGWEAKESLESGLKKTVAYMLGK